MGSENVSLNMEYSPLNKLSSSGEEVEQFTLPSAASNKYVRPKRRRKRKDFDAIRGPTFNPFTTAHCYRCGNCVLAIVIIILIASTCGLSVMLFYMSNTVTDIESRLSNLQVAKETTSSSLLTLQGKFNDLDEQLRQMHSNSQNHSSELKMLQNQISSLEVDLKNLKTVNNNVLSKGDKFEAIQKELAKLGSETLALKSDSASLKQQGLSFDSRLGELDASVRTLTSICQQAVTTPPHAATLSLDDIQASMKSLNQTHISDVSVLQSQINDTTSQLQQYLYSTVRQELASYNETVNELKVKLVSLDTPDCGSICHPIVQRIDQLETHLREMQQQLVEIVTTSFDDKVANLTFTAGIEDVITRVINQKTSTLQQMAEGAVQKADRLQAQLSNIEQVLISLSSSTTTAPPTTKDNQVNSTLELLSTNTTLASTATSDTPNFDSGTTTPLVDSNENPAHVEDISKSDLKAVLGQPLHTTTLPVLLDTSHTPNGD